MQRLIDNVFDDAFGIICYLITTIQSAPGLMGNENNTFPDTTMHVENMLGLQTIFLETQFCNAFVIIMATIYIIDSK
jgi:hypothetical protein